MKTVDLYTTGSGTVDASDNFQSEKGPMDEHRELDTIPSASAAYPTPKDVFLKGGNAAVSMQTPGEAGIKVDEAEKPSGDEYRHREGKHDYEQ